MAIKITPIHSLFDHKCGTKILFDHPLMRSFSMLEPSASSFAAITVSQYRITALQFSSLSNILLITIRSPSSLPICWQSSPRASFHAGQLWRVCCASSFTCPMVALLCCLFPDTEQIIPEAAVSSGNLGEPERYFPPLPCLPIF